MSQFKSTLLVTKVYKISIPIPFVYDDEGEKHAIL